MNLQLTNLAADLFLLHGHYYLLVADYNFNFVPVENLENSQSFTVINICQKIFWQCGIPKQLIIDLSLPITILRNYQRVGILNTKQSAHIITNETV